MDKWQSWEIEMQQADEHLRNEERRIHVAWFGVGLSFVIASGFVLWVLSVV